MKEFGDGTPVEGTRRKGDLQCWMLSETGREREKDNATQCPRLKYIPAPCPGRYDLISGDLTITIATNGHLCLFRDHETGQ
jgi:hypothetical protein